MRRIKNKLLEENVIIEYKVMEAGNSQRAEQIMNEMAREGWRVVSTAFWANFKALIIITFERETNQ